MLIITLCGCYIALLSSRVQTLIVQSITDDLSQELGTEISISKVDIRPLSSLVLKDFLIKDQKQDTLIYAKALVVKIDSIDFAKQQLYSNKILLESTLVNSRRYKDASNYNYQFLLDSLKSSDTTSTQSPWQFRLDHVRIENAQIRNNDDNTKVIEEAFDINHLNFKDITVDLETEKKDSSLYLKVHELKLKEDHSIKISKFNIDVELTSEHIAFNHFSLETALSKIDASDFMMKTKKDTSILALDKHPFKFKINKSSISLKDISFFVPSIKGMDEKIQFSGNVKGPIANLKLKDLELKLKDYTKVNGDVSFSGLPNFHNTFIFAKLEKASFDFRELNKVKLPISLKNKFLDLPTDIHNKNIITYSGEFTGFPSDFVCFGTMRGMLGELDTDIAIRPDNKGRINVSGKFNTKDFLIGSLLNAEKETKLTLRSNITGYYTKKSDYNLNIIGTIDDIQIENYIIHSIHLNGNAYTGGFKGGVTIRDPFLDLVFNGKADYLSDIPSYDFDLSVQNFIPAYLKIGEPSRIDTLNFGLKANFTGNNIDNFRGLINLNNFSISNDTKRCFVKDVKLTTNKSKDCRIFNIDSDFLNVNIEGHYTYKSLFHSIQNIISSNLPSLSTVSTLTSPNDIEVTGKITSDKGLINYFIPNTAVKFPITIGGNLTDSIHSAKLNISIPELYYNKNLVKKFNINLYENQGILNAKLRTSKITLSNNITLDNLALHSYAKNDTIASLFSWSNSDSITYSGNIPIETVISRDNEQRKVPIFEFLIRPSYIYVSDYKFKISDSKVKLDSTAIEISNFSIENNKHVLAINGKVSHDPSDSLNVSFNNVSIGKMDKVFAWDTGLSGIINGVLTMKDFYKNRIFLGDLKIKDFSFSDKPLGDILLKSDWNSLEKKLFSQLLLRKEDKNILDAHGTFTPSTNEMDYNAILDKVPFVSLMPFLKSFAFEIGGDISGDVKVQGKISHPYLTGDVMLDKGLIGIDFTKTTYRLTDTIRFVPDTMLFQNIIIKDLDNNEGRFDGYIKHDFFSNFLFNLNINTDYLSVLNTTIDDNEDFYGTANASGNVKLTGNFDDLVLDANVKTGMGTNISIPMEGPSNAAENSFVRFKKPVKFYKEHVSLQQSEIDEFFTFNLDLTMTPDAKFRIIFDRSSSDLIEGSGSGDLRIIYDKEQNLKMFGNYTIAKGNYNFTRQGFISKHFKVKENSEISWEGDPYKARLDLEAVYSTKASLYELLGESNSSSSDYTKRIKVDCIIKLTNELSNPRVDFAIELPTADERTKDEIAQYLSTKEEITRQMISILLIGKFTTPDYLKSGDTQTNNADIISATASELLSNQFSSWLSQISSDFDIGFNYRPGDNVSNRQIEVALSTQLLNNRVLINGNIGNNGSLQSNNANEIVGEVEVYVKLTPNGKLQLKVYNRSNDELYDTAPYTQGLGISFKENFNSFEELFKRYREKRIMRQEKRERKKMLKKQKRKKQDSNVTGE
ncbi:translocation/assembly module TamB domain-containing protein [Halosquirtibacter laminarini]|uniref:Translocation/assembly module TamB domain-containing protein n=1 Tax=Halosquirtibacter laminarini TaxID=3374600 RepID=A0AC61NFZ4_9BACT|nr:translocation/assembly module TamB domain-containing protein [Prolixibacteraceae bacterium]